MIINMVINAQCTMTPTLCITVAWCCGEPISYILQHLFHVLPFPLTDANCPPSSPTGGPGPLIPLVCRAVPISPGSTHLSHAVCYMTVSTDLGLYFRLENSISTVPDEDSWCCWCHLCKYCNLICGGWKGGRTSKGWGSCWQTRGCGVWVLSAFWGTFFQLAVLPFNWINSVMENVAWWVGKMLDN